VVRHLGVSQALVGNTVPVASVEADELARVAVPTRRGRPELALGNLSGTIIHFAVLNAGIIALVKPLSLVTRRFYLPATAASVLILALVLSTPRTLGRVEGAALLALYVSFVDRRDRCVPRSCMPARSARPRRWSSSKGEIACQGRERKQAGPTTGWSSSSLAR
jgi:hypothetical protein